MKKKEMKPVPLSGPVLTRRCLHAASRTNISCPRAHEFSLSLWHESVIRGMVGGRGTVVGAGAQWGVCEQGQWAGAQRVAGGEHGHSGWLRGGGS